MALVLNICAQRSAVCPFMWLGTPQYCDILPIKINIEIKYDFM